MLNTFSQLLPQGAERVMAAAGGVVGAALSFAFGSVGPLLWWLAIFMAADIVTGLVKAALRGEFKSSKLYIGMLKKAVMMAVVMLSHGLDVLFEPLIHFQIFQSVTICAYAAGEFGSIIENFERAGLGSAVPPVLRHLVMTLEERVESHANLELEKRGMKKTGKKPEEKTEEEELRK